MDERAALRLLADTLPEAGDDAAVVDDLVLTTDMLHQQTDFPDGTTRYTAGWRAVGASLSDIAAMGATPLATLAVYGATSFNRSEVTAFVRGAREVSELVGTAYVGGDLDRHQEFTVATTAIGETQTPVYRHGATPGDLVCVTGTLGRTAAALRLFEKDETERANELFRFEPRITTGQAVASVATAMMDSSDGLARSLHQLAAASDCGFTIDGDALPIDETVRKEYDSGEEREPALYVGEDFELVFTVPEAAITECQTASPIPITVIGSVVDEDILLNEEPLPDLGYTH